jgi:mRNA-degrading endonuclease RelE of RelBE toxin-antitoxin system
VLIGETPMLQKKPPGVSHRAVIIALDLQRRYTGPAIRVVVVARVSVSNAIVFNIFRDRGQVKGDSIGFPHTGCIVVGDYRIIFRVSSDNETVTVWKIGNRAGIYD